jgi:hypothetical protein
MKIPENAPKHSIEKPHFVIGVSSTGSIIILFLLTSKDK